MYADTSVREMGDSSRESSPANSPPESNQASRQSSLALIPKLAQGIIQGDGRMPNPYTFTVNTNPQQEIILNSEAFNQGAPPQDGHSPAYVFFYNNPANKASGEDVDEDGDVVTEKLIERINARVGEKGDHDRGRHLIDKMRELGGLEGDSYGNGHNVDIPAARMGLCMLACLSDNDNKLLALDSLYEILQRDNLTKRSSVKLVSLAIKLIEIMDRELMQAETIEIQTKLAQVYDLLTELLHQHYGKKHINAITDRLKLILVKTPKSLQSLNTQQDVKLKYHVSCAIEGSRRLAEDKKELFDLVERLYHAGASAASFAAAVSGNGIEAGFTHFELIFKDLDPHLKNSWYDAILVMKNLAIDAKKDKDQMAVLQNLIATKYKDLNWKFSYAAVLVLQDICLHGETEEIRHLAFSGVKQLGMPGLVTFVNCKELPKYYDMNAVAHLKRPRKTDPNNRIRHVAIEALINIIKHSPDPEIQTKAQVLWERRDERETDGFVREAISSRESSRRNSLKLSGGA